MSVIATLIALFLFCSVAQVAWGACKFLFVRVAFVALLQGRDHRRQVVDPSPASSYGS
jgi:hypothetical protein